MTQPEIDVDYLPSHVRDWGERHLELLELVANDLVASGSWPEIRVLTKRLAGAGKPTPLRSIFWGMPKPLGWIDHNPERIVLPLHGLHLTRAARPLLDGYFTVLRLAVDRFPKEGDEATIRRSDLEAVIEPELVGVLSMLLQSDSPFLAGFQGGEQDVSAGGWRALAEREHLAADGRWATVAGIALDRCTRAYREGGLDAIRSSATAGWERHARALGGVGGRVAARAAGSRICPA